MAHSISWYIPERLLCLSLTDQLSLEELTTINQSMTDILNGYHQKLTILIDSTEMKTGYQTADELRDTQDFMNHPKIDSVLMVSENKLNRLIMLMAFCVIPTKIIRFETMEKLEKFLKRSGYTDHATA